MLSVVRGSTVCIEIDTQTEAMEYINVSTVRISIIDPTGVFILTDAPMFSESDIGFFSYEHDTSTDGILGPYTAQITVTQGSFVYKPEPFVCFVLDTVEVPHATAFQPNAFQNNAFQV
jgi:hypothetical protein